MHSKITDLPDFSNQRHVLRLSKNQLQAVFPLAKAFLAANERSLNFFRQKYWAFQSFYEIEENIQLFKMKVKPLLQFSKIFFCAKKEELRNYPLLFYNQEALFHGAFKFSRKSLMFKIPSSKLSSTSSTIKPSR